MKYQHEVQLAGLLHDIGKFYQKVGKRKGVVGTIDVSGSHPKIGYKFVEYYKDIFETANLDVDVLKELVSRHHSKHYSKEDTNPLVQEAPKELISFCNINNIADNLSSNERHGKQDKDDYAPLESVYGVLGNKRVCIRLDTNLSTYEASSKDERVSFESNEERKKGAENLISLFTKDLESLREKKISDFNELYNELHRLMYTYTRYVNPSINALKSDASLFDHCSTTSALAGCIHRNLYKKYGDNFSYTKYNDIPKNIFIIKFSVNFDEYLESNRTTKDITKLFIGKSERIKNITKELVNDILRLTELNISNVIAKSINECYILIPECDVEAVGKYLRDKNKELFSTYNSKVFINVNMGRYDFSKNRVSLYDNLKNTVEINGLKNIFINCGKWDLKAFENNYIINSNTRKCIYCGRLTDGDICNHCADALKLSANTLNNNFSILYFKDFNYIKNLENGFIDTSDETDNSTISRVATYMRTNQEFFSNVVENLLNNKFKNARIILNNMDSCYVVCNNIDAFDIANVVLKKYKEYTNDTIKLVCAINGYKKSSKFINFIDDCENRAKSLNEKGYEVNIGNINSTYAELIRYIDMISKLKLVLEKEVSRTLVYRILSYINDLIKYTETGNAQYLMSVSLLTREGNKRYSEEEIKFIQDILGEAKEVLKTNKAIKLKMYREAINTVVREEV